VVPAAQITFRLAPLVSNEAMTDDLLTPEERSILASYRDPAGELRRAVRLSVQYLVGAGLFVVAAIVCDEPLLSLPAYLTFLAFVLLRLRGARRLAHLMPSVLAKYEARLQELESRSAMP